MTSFLTAPSERPPISNLGPVSSLCERIGCDVIWEGRKGLCGLQRKAIPDLIASVRDTRLGKEFVQMREAKLTAAFLVIEGTFQWSSEGELLGERAQWTIRHQAGVELSAQTKGVMVLHTRNPLETCAMAEYLFAWTQKEEHVSSLLARPGPQANGWGKLSNRDYAIHVLSGYQGISLELAGRIIDHYGHLPCRHDVVERALTDVPGIGKKRAESIAKVLG